MRSERWRPSGKHDSGAVAVETALVSVLLVTLLFGIVESSFLFRDWLTVSAAARAGARMGASEPRVPRFAQDSVDQVTNATSGLNPGNPMEVWVYEANNLTGTPASGSFTCATNCLKYTWDVSTKKFLSPTGSWDYTLQNACAGDVNRDALGVYVKYTHSALMGMFFNGVTVGESTVMWIEPSRNPICK
jgi:Flp pilus assembly protein TadG